MRLVFEVPDDLHARFKAETAARNLKQAAVVRFLVDSWLNDPDSGPKPAEPAPNTAEPVLDESERPLTRDEVLRRLRTKK